MLGVPDILKVLITSRESLSGICFTPLRTHTHTHGHGNKQGVYGNLCAGVMTEVLKARNPGREVYFLMEAKSEQVPGLPRSPVLEALLRVVPLRLGQPCAKPHEPKETTPLDVAE
jgi:hypothetical protein